MNTLKTNSPEELIPDDTDHYIKNGKQIRKGTIASAIMNAEILETPSATNIEKEKAIKMLEQLAPALCAVGLNKHFIWNNPVIQHIFDKEDKKSNKI
jgi:hypothetical protein